MRQIILDTETTGIGHESGHRIIEIGCIEMFDRELTGNYFHYYLNPQREVDEGAFKVHGISNEFLKDKPLFSEVVHEFMEYIDDAELVIHNAPFDLGFLNAELKRCKWKKRVEDQCHIIDTLVLAREKHPGQRNSLDALCKRYAIDNSNRKYHGALLDAEILAMVYLAMTGGQANLFAEDPLSNKPTTKQAALESYPPLSAHTPVLQPTAEEMTAHTELLQLIIKKSGVDRFGD